VSRFYKEYYFLNIDVKINIGRSRYNNMRSVQHYRMSLLHFRNDLSYARRDILSMPSIDDLMNYLFINLFIDLSIYL